MFENIIKFTSSYKDSFNFINMSAKTRTNLVQEKHKLMKKIAEAKEKACVRKVSNKKINDLLQLFHEEGELNTASLTIKYPKTGKVVNVSFDACTDEVEFVRKKDTCYCEFEHKVTRMAKKCGPIVFNNSIEFTDKTTIHFKDGRHMLFNNNLTYENRRLHKTSIAILCEFIVWCMYDVSPNVKVTLNIAKGYWATWAEDWISKTMKEAFPQGMIRMID